MTAQNLDSLPHFAPQVRVIPPLAMELPVRFLDDLAVSQGEFSGHDSQMSQQQEPGAVLPPVDCLWQVLT